MLYAIIDIGSATVRMAIYNIAYGRLEMLMKKKHTLGLASYVKNDVLQQKGIDKVCEILNEFRDLLTSLKIENVSAFTTAAIRNAKNSKEVIDKLYQRTHIPVKIISGEEEARLDFIGVMRQIDSKQGLIVDVGGGSTEIISYNNSAITEKISLPVGALLLHTKYVEDFLPSSDEINDMRSEINDLLAKSNLKNLPPEDVCCIGGTAKSLRLLYNELFGCEKDNMQLQADKLTIIIERYTRDKKLAQEDLIMLLRTAPDRLKTLLPGIVIIDTICRHFHAEKLTYSDTGMREGFIYDQIIDKK